MKLYLKFILRNILFVCFLVLIFSCDRDSIKFESGRVLDSFGKNSNGRRKIFVLFVDEKCGSCKNFEEFLVKQSRTKEILNSNYLSYKIDISDSSMNELAKILKVPSVPFPYFFDKEGELEAFGFPNQKNYDISNLKNITIEQKIFSEIFRLPISVSEYKKMVSSSLKAFIALRDKDSLLAKRYILSSLDISVYPYNIRFFNQYFGDHRYIYKVGDYNPTRSDERLYGNINDYILLRQGDNDFLNKGNSKEQYFLSKDEIDLGKIEKNKIYNFEFGLISNSDSIFYITDVNHPCSCISLDWSKNPIKKSKLIPIKGKFHADIDGKFVKEIYIHSSERKKVGIFYLKGEII
ncbi:DUF1573 domain-containing protein [Sphingobacterium sp.]|uniref:DUF1573 domain-containing protein n=1 Tax=Sphingobacterium sp. TaxID=341027 RepID=UPI0028A2D57D|nr:DUF1573 domain-containing protein [Sphingobacterium sp.]